MHASSYIPEIEGKKTHYSVIIIGAGQAGLSMSYCLAQADKDHLILEKSDRVANNWRNERWDEFCLVTPNWQCQLPGYKYSGSDPDGFMVKDEIVDYIQGYYESFLPPIKFDTEVTELKKLDGRFHIFTRDSKFTAEQVVIACGSYHRPNILPLATGIPESITQIHSRDYKNPDLLPEGELMVIGTGQSGCQIAEDLHLQGRQVHLSVGTAPRVNRRYRGKDVVNWLDEMGYYKMTIDEHPDGKNAPHATNHYVTGRDGGRDLNLRIFAEQGMKLYGKLSSIENGVVSFENDLQENLDYADSVAERIRNSIEEYIQKNDIEAPADTNLHSQYLPDTLKEMDFNESKISCVIWATGFKMEFDWIKLPIFDASGRPMQKRGVTQEEGLYFLGLNWMNTWGSGRFFHVGRDAEFLAEKIKRDSLEVQSC